MIGKPSFILAAIVVFALPFASAKAADRIAGPIEGAQLKAAVSPLVIRMEAALSSWEIRALRREGLTTQVQCDWQRGQYVPASHTVQFTCGGIAAGRTLQVFIRERDHVQSCLGEMRSPSVPKGAPTVLVVEKRPISPSASSPYVVQCRWSP